MVLKDPTCDSFREDENLIVDIEKQLLAIKPFKPHLQGAVLLPPPTDSYSSDCSSKNGDVTFERGGWSRQMDFFLSCVGYAVGLGNIWRFPYLCYRSGGGAFLIPYLLFLVICGFPLFFLEMSFGQFASLGPITIWKISPLFKGLGYGMVLISGIVCIYYNVIIAWTLYYIYQTFTSVVPWATCDNPWNTANCLTHRNGTNSTLSEDDGNYTGDAHSTGNKTTASEEFWKNNVLHLSLGIEELGEIQWPLFWSLLVAWIVIFLCLMRGVKSSGKVVYVSATFPYIVLIILFIRGITLPGAMEGIKFYLTPRWELLTTFKVWGDAATQIFYSVGASWGAILTMASFNRFSNNCYRDSMIIPIINCGTSIFAGLVVFSIIGFMAYETGKPIDEVVSQGPGLAFVVYPEAVAKLPISPLWAFLFFLMLFTIGLDSQFGMFETMISAFVDEFPALLKRRKVAFTAFMCGLLFVLGIPCVTQGGMYVLQLMDWYSATFSLMIISFFETIVIGWIYGVDRFMHDIFLMVKRYPPTCWKLCWCYITPLTILALLCFIFANHSPVTYDTYEYPGWAIGLGWLMAVCSIIPIPLLAIIQLCKCKGTFKQRLVQSLQPAADWGPAKEENRILYKKSLAVVTSKFPQPQNNILYFTSHPSSGKLSLNSATVSELEMTQTESNV